MGVSLYADANVALDCLQDRSAVLVTIDSFEGSSPREAGAWMLVFADDVAGTVGGGNLEFQAIAHGRNVLSAQASSVRQKLPVNDELRRYPLGPSLGQCCGGVVHLKFAFIAANDAIKIEAARAVLTLAKSQNRLKIALFGGGHVGKALVNVMGALPVDVQWVDSRDEIFPANIPANTTPEHSSPVHATVQDLPAGSHLLVMSFSHAEDLDVVIAALQRLRAKNDLGFIGLIGSKTKWATFRHRLQERGFSNDEIARVTCPIGKQGVQGKEPEVIAVSVAAQLMQLRTIAS